MKTYNTLTLIIKRKWFEEIRAGRKTVEYREDKPYWRRRLMTPWGEMRKFYQVEFRNGYGYNVPSLVTECIFITLQNLVVEGLSAGKARSYFCIKLGKALVIRTNDWKEAA